MCVCVREREREKLDATETRNKQTKLGHTLSFFLLLDDGALAFFGACPVPVQVVEKSLLSTRLCVLQLHQKIISSKLLFISFLAEICSLCWSPSSTNLSFSRSSFSPTGR